MKEEKQLFENVKTERQLRVFCRLLNLQELSKNTGINATSLSSWRTGRLRISEENINKIMVYLNKKYEN